MAKKQPVSEATVAVDVATIPSVRSETYANIYANNTAMAMTKWDFCLRFSQMQVVNQKAVMVEHASVFMSPQHAKAHLALLRRQIDLYEQNFGFIPDLVDEEPRTP